MSVGNFSAAAAGAHPARRAGRGSRTLLRHCAGTQSCDQTGDEKNALKRMDVSFRFIERFNADPRLLEPVFS